MTLLHLRYFCVVAKHESISKAAGELTVSQPALSKVIKSLEKELGCELFARNGRNIHLTPEGKVFYENISRGLSIIDDAVNTASATPAAREIHICINVADMFFDDLIAEYYQQHNDVSFVITNSVAPELRASSHEDDLSVYTARSSDTLTESTGKHVLYTERFGLCVPRSDPLAKESSIDLIQAKDRRFLGSASYGVNHSFCLEAGFSPRILIVGQNVHTYLKMLEYSGGVSILPEISLGPYLPPNCVFVPLRNPMRMRTVVIAENPMKSTSTHVKDFLNFCLERCKEVRAKYPYQVLPKL